VLRPEKFEAGRPHSKHVMSTLLLFGDSREVILAEIAEGFEGFGSPRLTVELVPTNTWGSNPWSVLRSSHWNRLPRRTYEAAQHRCEVCGGIGAKWPVACHERWEFEDWSCTQCLSGLIALCPACHDVKHIGRAMLMGRGDEATAHLRTVNAWSPEQVDGYLALAFGLWKLRTLEEKWYVDLSWLKQFNIQPQLR